MSPTPEFLARLVGCRADALAVTLLALLACWYTHAQVRRRNARAEFPRFVCLTVVVLAVAGALLAEWTALVLGYPAAASLATLVLARAAVLGSAALLGGVLLVTAARVALLRAELRAHADAERQLQQAIRAADEANRAKGDFLAVMSHEIRTPLNAVMGFANLLAGTRLDDAQRGYVHTITDEGTRLSALINDILDLTKIEEGRLILERLPFAPVETAQDVLRLLSARAAEKKLELRFEVQMAEPLLVSGDPLRFRQILVNLVDNAIKFTPQGSVTLFLGWTPPADCAGPRGRLRLRVRDTGIGIASDKVKDLFQMFMQADTSTSRRYGGTGLGLAICQRLVSLMEGEITARSNPGAGSEFEFTLPMTPLTAPLPAAAGEDETPLELGYVPRILVADDMETNRFLLEVFLRRNGFEPDLASGGAEAVRKAAERRYDAILMDLQMPDLDGFEATRQIRAAEPPGQRTPIIALTATIARDTREKCLAAGMDEHFSKPLDLRKFRILLSRFVRARVVPAAAP